MTEQAMPPSGTTTSLPLARELLLLGLLALLWGSSYLLIRVALESLPPVTLIALRVGLAALVLLAVVRWQGHRLPRDPALWRQLFVQSLLNATAAWTLLAWGQQYVDSGLAGVLNSTSPIFVFFITLLVTRHEALSPLKLIGALLGVAGVTLIIGVEVLGGLGRAAAAQIAVLLGAFLYGCAAVNGKRFSALPPTVTAAAVMLCATAVLLPAALVLDRPWALRPSALSLAAAAALALFCTALALLLYFRLVRTLGSLGVASQAYLRAGVSVMLGILLLGESFRPEVGLGLAAVILGVAAINLPARRLLHCNISLDFSPGKAHVALIRRFVIARRAAPGGSPLIPKPFISLKYPFAPGARGSR
ncbi:MAG TPA: EamA family transporter [Kiloniellaceae bacterium]|nr:EamA family transporter [Kiloniellaceae bacterium]